MTVLSVELCGRRASRRSRRPQTLAHPFERAGCRHHGRAATCDAAHGDETSRAAHHLGTRPRGSFLAAQRHLAHAVGDPFAKSAFEHGRPGESRGNLSQDRVGAGFFVDRVLPAVVVAADFDFGALMRKVGPRREMDELIALHKRQLGAVAFVARLKTER